MQENVWILQLALFALSLPMFAKPLLYAKRAEQKHMSRGLPPYDHHEMERKIKFYRRLGILGMSIALVGFIFDF